MACAPWIKCPGEKARHLGSLPRRLCREGWREGNWREGLWETDEWGTEIACRKERDGGEYDVTAFSKHGAVSCAAVLRRIASRDKTKFDTRPLRVTQRPARPIPLPFLALSVARFWPPWNFAELVYPQKQLRVVIVSIPSVAVVTVFFCAWCSFFRGIFRIKNFFVHFVIIVWLVRISGNEFLEVLAFCRGLSVIWIPFFFVYIIRWIFFNLKLNWKFWRVMQLCFREKEKF